jgi:hypothetical protein
LDFPDHRRWQLSLDAIREGPEAVAMLGTIVSLICWVWVIEVAAGVLMYCWAICKRRCRQTEPAHAYMAEMAGMAPVYDSSEAAG